MGNGLDLLKREGRGLRMELWGCPTLVVERKEPAKDTHSGHIERGGGWSSKRLYSKKRGF